MRRLVIGAIIVAVGVMALLRVLGVDEFMWFFNMQWMKYFWPVLVIVIGLKVIFTCSNHHSCGGRDNRVDGMVDRPTPAADEDGVMKMSSAFSGGRYDLTGEQFRGAKIDLLCGGMVLDLRQAIIEEDCTISVSALMGGAEILVPENLCVKIQSSSLLGGVGHGGYPRNNIVSEHTLFVKASCLLGGVSIKPRK